MLQDNMHMAPQKVDLQVNMCKVPAITIAHTQYDACYGYMPTETCR